MNTDRLILYSVFAVLGGKSVTLEFDTEEHAREAYEEFKKSFPKFAEWRNNISRAWRSV